MPYPVWRVWMRRKATLEEMETHWSILDVARANDALDVEDDMQRVANKGDK